MGKVLSVSDGTHTTTYVYDSQNQLLRENNQAGQFTHTWEYDNAGNIQCRKEYAYTTGALGTPTDTVEYTYGDSGWGDLLTAYDGTAITYDEIGNPDAIGGWSFTWEHGRELASMSNGTTTWTNTYNADGIRTQRTDGTTTYHYIYTGSSLTQLQVGADTLFFNYDGSGTPLTVTYNGVTYYYATNLQGDITAILDSTGTAVVTYTYDAWGNPLSTTGTLAATLGAANPLRYRGYVYDTETGLYYLQSRYYDPEIGRFLNADGYTSTGQGFSGNNTFVYCGNDPVLLVDSSGTRHEISAGAVGPYDPDDYAAYRERQKYAEEYAVLEGKTNTYKGVEIVRVENRKDSYSFSFGKIYLNTNTSIDIAGVRLLRHEYGHTKQLEELGTIGYTIMVVLPSATGALIDRLDKLKVDYYSLPWEFEADLYGSVPDRGNYDPRVWEWYIAYRKDVYDYLNS